MGEVRFYNGVAITLIDSSFTGSTADWFYYETDVVDTREVHVQYNVEEAIESGQKIHLNPDTGQPTLGKYIWIFTCNEDQLYSGEPLKYTGWTYATRQTYYGKIIAHTTASTGSSISTFTVLINRGAEDSTTDIAYGTDLDTYSNSEVIVNRYGISSITEAVPDVGDSAIIEVSGSEEVTVTTNEDNDTVYIVGPEESDIITSIEFIQK